MAMSSLDEQYFVYENRLASFHSPQPVTKRRASNASSRAPKALTWPHKKLSPASFAKAGFFFQPNPSNPDNVVCFLCNKSLDGWEEVDDPLVEHLKHVPDCGWAVVAAIEAEVGDYAKMHPLDPRMTEARKATFAGRWPYDSKKGFKCKTKQLVDAGWYYAPTVESDDMTTCAYCQLALDGWKSTDRPLDEHYKRSPHCPYFELISRNPPPKKARSTKASRASKASRLSVQSVATVASEMHSAAGDITAEHDDSVMTTTSVATQGGKKGRGRKTAGTKARKTRAKKEEAVEILEDEQDADVPPPPPPKPTRGRKRGSDAVEDSIITNAEAPAAKKRATRGGTSKAAADSFDATSVTSFTQDEDMTDVAAPPRKPPTGRKKGRASNAKTTTRKVSAASLRSKASTASLRAEAAMDDELERQLQADLERPLTEDEYMTADSDSERKSTASVPAKSGTKKAASSRKAPARSQQEKQDDYAMFNPAPVEHDDAEVDEELKALEAEMKAEQERQPLEVLQKGKKAGTRKVSKQSKKVKEPEAPPPPPQPVDDEPSEDSIVVSEMAPEPAVAEDPDTSSGTVVNKTGANATKAGRGRPKKKSSLVSQPAAKKHQPEPAITTAPSLPEPREMEIQAAGLRDSVPVPPSSAADAADIPALSAQPQETTGMNKALPLAPPPPPPHSEKPSSQPLPPPATPRSNRVAPTASAKQATISPSQSPQSSDAENQPPSSKPASSAAAKRVILAPVPLPPATTPLRNANVSPSRRTVLAGLLRSTQPWKGVDLDLVFALVGEGEGAGEEVSGLLKRGGKELSTPEREMSVEEWIFYNAGLAEEMLKGECEAMVGRFEDEGGRAMRVLEGLVVE